MFDMILSGECMWCMSMCFGVMLR